MRGLEKDVKTVERITWSDLRGEPVCFVDGGQGQLEMMTRMPLVVRAGAFKVITGERDLDRRERFETYPILVGDLESGLKTSEDYAAVVRIIIELLCATHVLEDSEYSDVRVLMLHGPLCYRLSAYTDHYFSQSDVCSLITSSAKTVSTDRAEELVNGYLSDSRVRCISSTGCCRSHFDKRTIRAVCFIRFLLSRIFAAAKERNIMLMGVVERSSQAPKPMK